MSLSLRHLRLHLLTALLLALPSSLWAEPVVVTTGKPGGYYESVANRLRFVLDTDLDRSVEIVNSEGSIENLVRLADPESPVNVGLTQADALAHFLKDAPAFEDQYVVLARIGRECAFLISRAKGGIDAAGDLKRKSRKHVAQFASGI